MKWRDITHISWRNIRARPGHTFMIVLTLALALAEVLMVIALAIGLQQLDVTQKAGSVGQIITIGTATNQSAHNDLLLVPETLTKVKNLKGVTGVTGVIKREAQLKGATQTIPTTILGIETEYTKVLDAKVTKGTLPQKGEIALSGKQLASLGLCSDQSECVGQTVTLLVADVPYAGNQGKEQQIPLKLSGIVSADAASSFVSINDVRLFTINQPYSYILAKTTTPQINQEVIRKIQNMGLAIYDSSQSLFTTVSNTTSDTFLRHTLIEVFELVSMVVFVVITFAILALSLANDRRDITNFRLIGAQTGDIIKLITAETSILTTLSGLLAIIFAVGLSRIVLTLLGVFAIDQMFQNSVAFEFPPVVLLGTALFASIIGFLAGNYVGWEALRLGGPDTIDIA